MLPDVERRRFLRLVAETQATVTRVTTQQVLPVKLINLSASGCAFFCDQPFEQGERVDFLVTSPSERIEALQRLAEVTRVNPGEGDYLIGIEFLPD